MVFFWYIFKKSKTLTKNDSNILFSKSIRLFCNEIFSNILIICSTHEISSTEAIVFIIDEIIKNYSVIENFKLILDKYFLKNSKIITETLIQNILKTLVLILEISNEGMNKILSNKFLDNIGETV